MTASELLSLSERVRSEVSFQTFALNCCVPETLSEVVLGTVSSSMTSVTDDGDDQLSVFLVVGENAFETVAEVVEVLANGNLRLDDARLDAGGGQRARKLASVHAELPRVGLEEGALRHIVCAQDIESRRLSLHARLRGSGRLGRLLHSTGK
jgi:hypothetical protein